MRKFFLGLFFLFMLSTCFAAITNLRIPSTIRLGENLTISGETGESNILCKFVVFDSNNFAVERLSDEYTFSDGSFYSQRVLQEPPYYRGDDFNAVVSCGSSESSSIFTVLQPVSLAHPVQMWWEYAFQDANKDAVIYLASFVGLIVLSAAVIVLAIKKGKSYAS